MDLSEYDTLLSVVPPSDLEAAAVRDLIAQLGWSYVSVISSAEYDSVAKTFIDTGNYIKSIFFWKFCFKPKKAQIFLHDVTERVL